MFVYVHVFIRVLLCVPQVVSDGFPVIQAVVPKTQTRSITQGSDILVRTKFITKPRQ